jgi:hypothetical protein
VVPHFSRQAEPDVVNVDSGLVSANLIPGEGDHAVLGKLLAGSHPYKVAALKHRLILRVKQVHEHDQMNETSEQKQSGSMS